MLRTTESNMPRAAKWGWGILLALSIMLTLNGIMLYFFIADSHLMRTVSVLETGLGLLTLVIIWEGFRRGSRWAWNATWVLVTLLGVLGLHILTGGDRVVSLWYLSLAAVALAGQMLAARGIAS